MTKHLFAVVAVLACCTLAVGCFESDDGDGDNTGGTGGNNDGGSGGGGSGGGGADCSFAPCGGDVVGTWNSDAFCSPATTGVEGIPECEDAVVDGAPEVEGSVTFNADGTYSQDTSIVGSFRAEYDDDCVDAMTDGMMTAEALCAMYEAIGAQPGAPFTADCTYAAGWCKCDLTMDTQDSASGTYTTSGSTVTLGSGSPHPYCVDGNELRVSTEDGAVSIFRK